LLHKIFKMKTFINIALLIICHTDYTFAQSVQKDSSAIKETLTDFFEVFTNPDMKFFDKNCDAAFELLEHGEVWRRPEIKAYVDRQNSQEKTYKRTNQFDFIKINVHKNFAWVNYWNTAQITSLKENKSQTLRWLESIILEKRKGKWILLQMHSTRVPVAK
jgi:hypothetical protein